MIFGDFSFQSFRQICNRLQCRIGRVASMRLLIGLPLQSNLEQRRYRTDSLKLFAESLIEGLRDHVLSKDRRACAKLTRCHAIAAV
jgi:hypothetical protein